jgi:hypothetical protein
MSRAFHPVKPCDPELPKAAVRRLFDQVGGAKTVALRLSLGLSQTYAFADAGAHEEITFARVAALTSPTAPAAAEYLAGLAGGYFQPLAAGEGGAQQLTAAACREHGEAIASVVAALADGQITAAEAREALTQVDEALAAMCALRRLLLDATTGGR